MRADDPAAADAQVTEGTHSGGGARRGDEANAEAGAHVEDAAPAAAGAPAQAGAPAAYDTRAAEYAAALGSLHAVHPSDRVLVETWASGVDGTILDAGCGPGHWTAHLHGLGTDAWGLDAAPAFITHAHQEHPGVRYEHGDLAALPVPTGSLGGVLAWYSLIHLDPRELELVLAGLHGALRPGGHLLLGFFTGPDGEPFDHAVHPARTWSPERLSGLLERAGFTVVETHTRTAPEHRPHGAITAVSRGEGALPGGGSTSDRAD